MSTRDSFTDDELMSIRTRGPRGVRSYALDPARAEALLRVDWVMESVNGVTVPSTARFWMTLSATTLDAKVCNSLSGG